MSNTKFNSSGVLIFDDATQVAITGTQHDQCDEDDLSLFAADDSAYNKALESNLTIERDLLPTTSANQIEAIADSQFRRTFVGLEELANFVLPDNILEIVELSVEKALPGKWVRIDYDHNCSYHDEIAVDEQAIIFDVETFVTAGNLPIVAQALSTKALWCWLHESWDGKTKYTKQFVNLGEYKRTIVAHNAAFDFARIQQRFQMNNPVTIVDTMSLVNCLHGMDSSSRWALLSKDSGDYRANKLKKLGCAKSLVASYNFCCREYPALTHDDKVTRNIFVEAVDFNEFINNKNELLKYSMLDVIYTFRLFKSLYFDFIKWSGSYSVLLGQSIVADALLPVQPDRSDWITRCEDLSNFNLLKINSLVFDYFLELHDSYLNNTLEMSSSLLQVNWKLQKPKGWRKRTLPEGYPTMSQWWYSFVTGELGVTSLDFARLLQLEYYDADKWRPLMQHRSLGWYFKDEFGMDKRLPHASGNDDNVGNPMSSDSLRFFDDFALVAPVLRSKTLEYNDELLYEILRLCDSLTLWRGFGNRIREQIVM